MKGYIIKKKLSSIALALALLGGASTGIANASDIFARKNPNLLRSGGGNADCDHKTAAPNQTSKAWKTTTPFDTHLFYWDLVG
jgi:hypothetical protein